MKTRKELLRLFLYLIDARNDYADSHAIISDKTYLFKLINQGKIDHHYLSYAIDNLMEAANLTPYAVASVWTEISPLLYNRDSLTIKKVVWEVYKHQK